MSSPVRAYLSKYKGDLKKVAFFCTEGGSGGNKAFREMEKISGKKPIEVLELTTSEVKKEEYIDKVKEFTDKIKNN